jgi:hypothetical protein
MEDGMGAMKTYKLLGPEEKQLLKDKVVSMNRPIDELLKAFRAIGEYDRQADKARGQFGCGGALLIVLSIPLAIVAVNISPLLFILPVVAIAAAVWLITTWKKMAGLDLSNNLRDFVVPVLTIFREEVDTAEPMQVKLDLRPATCPEKKKSEQQLPVTKPVTKMVESTFLDEWFQAEARLATGGRVRWNIADEIRERSRTKRNPRGKYKTKVKYRKRTDIDVALSLLKQDWVIDSTPAPDVKIGGDEKKSVIRVSRVVETDSLAAIEPAAFLDVVGAAYRRAKPAQ